MEILESKQDGVAQASGSPSSCLTPAPAGLIARCPSRHTYRPVRIGAPRLRERWSHHTFYLIYVASFTQYDGNRSGD